MKKLISKYLVSFLLMLFLSLIGAIFIIFRSRYLAESFFRFIATIITIIGLFKLTLIDKDRLGKLEYNLDLYEGIIDLVVGVIFANFYQYLIVDFILFALFITLPICRCFYSPKPINQIFVDSPKFIIAITIIFASNFTFEGLFVLIGSIFILLGVGIFIRKIIIEHKECKKEMRMTNYEEEQN